MLSKLIRSTLAVLFLSLAIPAFPQSPAPQKTPALIPLEAFLGEWSCSGKFEGSGKVIEAHQSFRYDLDNKWILFRHDDQPPFLYHALAEWGWDKPRNELVMFVQDSGGGIRKFHSPGMQSGELVWDGDALRAPDPERERFTFQTIDSSHFKVSYFVLRDNAWKLVDASLCSK